MCFGVGENILHPMQNMYNKIYKWHPFVIKKARLKFAVRIWSSHILFELLV